MNYLLNKECLGQVFTENKIVSQMKLLIKNNGNILEPSAGDGAFSNSFSKEIITSIEFDKYLADKNGFLNIDFFEYNLKNKFNTIIGNPPYVRYKQINNNTLQLIENNGFNNLFDKRTNLYSFFIYKSILHLKTGGELIFITPKDFLKATSCVKLNEFIFNNGTITDIIDMSDNKIFKTAAVDTIIWRFEKDNFSRITNHNLSFTFNQGQLLFLKDKYNIKLKEIAFVKVGAVSGAKYHFDHVDGIDFVCSYTGKSKKLKRMLYNVYHNDLEKHKDFLINRKCKKFSNDNWWKWGRTFYESNKPRVYVNNKTRTKQPFFISNCNAYDGSVLAIFPLKEMNHKMLEQFCNDLNSVCWKDLGFLNKNRYIFNQKSLENILLPDNFKKYL